MVRYLIKDLVGIESENKYFFPTSAGNSGQVLTSQGPGNKLKWDDPSALLGGSNLVLFSSYTLYDTFDNTISLANISNVSSIQYFLIFCIGEHSNGGGPTHNKTANIEFQTAAGAGTLSSISLFNFVSADQTNEYFPAKSIIEIHHPYNTIGNTGYFLRITSFVPYTNYLNEDYYTNSNINFYARKIGRIRFFRSGGTAGFTQLLVRIYYKMTIHNT